MYVRTDSESVTSHLRPKHINDDRGLQSAADASEGIQCVTDVLATFTVRRRRSSSDRSSSIAPPTKPSNLSLSNRTEHLTQLHSTLFREQAIPSPTLPLPRNYPSQLPERRKLLLLVARHPHSAQCIIETQPATPSIDPSYNLT